MNGSTLERALARAGDGGGTTVGCAAIPGRRRRASGRTDAADRERDRARGMVQDPPRRCFGRASVPRSAIRPHPNGARQRAT
jgi:hypothetical protein